MIARELLVKLGFNIDEKKLDRFSNNIAGIKAQIQDLRAKIALNIEPNSNVDQLIAYKKELQGLSATERKEIEELNRQETLRAKADIKHNRQKLRDLTAIKTKLQETNNEFRRAATAAQNANQTFSRFFSRFAFAATGGIGLNIRSTLKEAKEFKEGKVNKASGGFTKEQINSVDRFNSTLMQTRRITSGIRNNLVTELLPSIKEYLDLLNSWLLTNKELIKLKFKSFMSTIAKSFKSVFGVFKSFYNVLDPLVQLIGGWSTILTGFIGAGILSWVVRLGLFLGRTAKAILFAAGAVRTLSLALLANPLALLIGGVGAALTLLTNEIYVTIKGGDSLINRFAFLRTTFDLTRIVIEGFIDGLKEAWHWLGIVGDKVKEFSFGAFDKVTSFFKEPLKIKLLPEIVPPKELEQIGQTDQGLKIYKSSSSAGSSFRLKESVLSGVALGSSAPQRVEPRTVAPSSISSAANNKNMRNVINNRNNINLSVNLAKGTTESQAREITALVEEKLRENNAQNNLETLNAIGAY